MTERLYVGRYSKSDIEEVLRSFGYNRAIIFDGAEFRGTRLPFDMGESDRMIYHLAGFLTVLDKRVTRLNEIPIVLFNVTEYLDESVDLEKYIAKIRKYGRDIFIFSTENEVQRGLILSVKLVDYSKKDEPSRLDLIGRMNLSDTSLDLISCLIDNEVYREKISTSLIQRILSVGYGKAAYVIDELTECGLISEPSLASPQKPRRLIVSVEELRRILNARRN